MSSKVRLLLVLTFVFSLLSLSVFAVTWRLADDQPAGYPTVLGDQLFANIVSEMTHGKISIKVYYGAQLGAETQTTQETISGVIQINRVNAAPLASFDPELGVLSLPYIFSSSKQEWKVLYGKVGQELLNSMKSVGLIGLTYYDSGQRSFFTRHTPILKPSDMKGLKIRVQKSPVFVAMVKAMGGSPIPMAYSSVYTALQSGVIDGAENNIPSYYTMSFYQVAPYYSYDGHSRVPEILFMNLKAWNSLTPTEKTIFRTAAMAASLYERQLWKARVQEDLSLLKKAGVHFYYPTPADIALFQKAVEPVYAKYSKFKDIITAIRNTK